MRNPSKPNKSSDGEDVLYHQQENCQKFPTFYEIRPLILVLSSACYWLLRSIILLTFHFLKHVFPSGSPPESSVYLFFRIVASLILFHLITHMITTLMQLQDQKFLLRCVSPSYQTDISQAVIETFLENLTQPETKF